MRVTRGQVKRKKHKKILKLTKGFKGGQSKIFVAAMQSMMRALKRSYAGRRIKKRDFRSLWIQRINAQAKEMGISYSRFIDGLKKSGIDLNRKTLAEMAVNDKEAFKVLVEKAQSQIA
jgi:large subunit ribosomal protein L20